MRVEAKARRNQWVAKLAKLSGSFGSDSTRMRDELRTDISKNGIEALLDHLRLCGAVPERCEHDSSEEKLYSKYTDALVCEALVAMGLRSAIIDARADAADVQARGRSYSLVADAKAFRLSRTAKNQKDFKVQALDGWRGDFDFAVLVCPIYQAPSRASQIYQQAIARNVCIISYAHLACLVRLAMRKSKSAAEAGLRKVLESVNSLNPTKSANDYWREINGALAGVMKGAQRLWTDEKVASLEALDLAKREALTQLRSERNRMLGLSHEEALRELVRLAGLDSRIAHVERIAHGGLLEE